MTLRRSLIADPAVEQPLPPAREPSTLGRTFVCLEGIVPLGVKIELGS
jgi:hypothetical protein